MLIRNLSAVKVSMYFCLHAACSRFNRSKKVIVELVIRLNVLDLEKGVCLKGHASTHSCLVYINHGVNQAMILSAQVSTNEIGGSLSYDSIGVIRHTFPDIIICISSYQFMFVV